MPFCCTNIQAFLTMCNVCHRVCNKSAQSTQRVVLCVRCRASLLSVSLQHRHHLISVRPSCVFFFGFNDSWQPTLMVHYCHQLDWSALQESKTNTHINSKKTPPTSPNTQTLKVTRLLLLTFVVAIHHLTMMQSSWPVIFFLVANVSSWQD